MTIDYCDYPPRAATDLEINEQQDGARTNWIIGSSAVNRFIILRETEFKVFQLIDEDHTPPEICATFKQLYGGNLMLATLTKFLTKLDQVGILAGHRSAGYGNTNQQVMRQPYIRFKLFNPDTIFARMVPLLRWIWTPGFLLSTVLLMLFALLLSALNWPELATHSNYIIREHYVATLVAAWMVVMTHEFAHGLTCKAFGGKATEIGVLGVYYFLPALYCNISGIHRIEKRGRRLWVIAAGVYWQLLVGTIALLCWFLVAPHTLLSDVALIICLGSLLNIVFNANPLIKLDGYYFLSQWLRLPNLMDRSRGYWRGLWQWIAYGERDEAIARYNAREKIIYAIFGFLSVVYSLLLTYFIVTYISNFLIDKFQLLGVLLAIGIVLLYIRRPIKSLIKSASHWISAFMVEPSQANLLSTTAQTAQTATTLVPAARKAVTEQPAAASVEKPQPQTKPQTSEKPKISWRRKFVPLLLLLAVIAILLLPWEASVSGFGTLVPLPEKESIISTPEAGLVAVLVKPGNVVTAGTELARLRNPDLSSDLIGLRADIARVEADYQRLVGELQTTAQATDRAAAELNQAARIDRELKNEQQQILARKLGGGKTDVNFPAALAVLQADIDLKKSRLGEAETQLSRTRQLFNDNLIPKSDLETAENKVQALRLEMDAAREKLQNAIVEHRRSVEKSDSEVRINQSALQSAQSTVTKTSSEIEGTKHWLETLRQREQVLLSKQTSVILTAPRDGIVLGENLLELNGKYLPQGGEVCRIAETKQLRVRIQIPEREIGDVKEGANVRLKTRALVDRVFQGRVEKIGSEAEADENKQLTYRVELIVDNKDGALKAGMSAFARIDFGRQTVGWILLHKIKQALRPELWLF